MPTLNKQFTDCWKAVNIYVHQEGTHLEICDADTTQGFEITCPIVAQATAIHDMLTNMPDNSITFEYLDLLGFKKTGNWPETFRVTSYGILHSTTLTYEGVEKLDQHATDEVVSEALLQLVRNRKDEIEEDIESLLADDGVMVSNVNLDISPK